VIDPGVLASRLRRARLALGLTQQALADAAGVGHATVERLERAAGDDAVQLALVDCGLDLLTRSRRWRARSVSPPLTWFSMGLNSSTWPGR
jgi:transcriptional regulator with XRE-family HTH domain